jgi:hypothetical protein
LWDIADAYEREELLKNLGLKKRDIRQVVRLADNHRRFVGQHVRVKRSRKRK